MSGALTRLMDDPTLLDRIARGGRAAAERFRTHAIAARMLADFASLVEERAG